MDRIIKFYEALFAKNYNEALANCSIVKKALLIKELVESGQHEKAIELAVALGNSAEKIRSLRFINNFLDI